MKPTSPAEPSPCRTLLSLAPAKGILSTLASTAVCLCVAAGILPAAAETPWTNLTDFLVVSDGSHIPAGDKPAPGVKRDRGSQIVFFDSEKGDNAVAEIYWWDGNRIVDSSGSPTNAEGKAYGTDPLLPNEEAIQAFKHPLRDPRLQNSEGYPDWFLLRRGQTHDTFEIALSGGRSKSEPMVVAAYGPVAEGRAVVAPEGQTPFGAHTGGRTVVQFHQVLSGLEVHGRLSHLGMHAGCTSPGEPGVPTWLIEDCKLINGQMNYLPIGTTMRKCVSMFRWSAESHNQGYFTSGFDAAPTFDEVIFYKNGYKTDPRIDPDPRRTIFDRNIYQGGGAQMGHTYRNIISADGGSGGPQMRLGGLCENSLIIEGYWFSSTASNRPNNTWLAAGGQSGRSAIVRNNVQFIYKYPSPADPDTDSKSDSRAQPGWGYTMQGASFGGVVENNIVSGAMLIDDLGFRQPTGGAAFSFAPRRDEYQDGNSYTMQRCTLRGNIGYRTRFGLRLNNDWTDAMNHLVENNVFVAEGTVGCHAENLTSANQLVVRNNRFYAGNNGLPHEAWIGTGNTLAPCAQAAATENWPDPDRTLKRYVQEVLKLTLLDWSDDPRLDRDEVARRVKAGETYDPTGLKTFMAVATNMRRGGTDPIPTSGKPSWTADYPWDARFTGQAVVNWVRAGFGMKPVGASGEPPGETAEAVQQSVPREHAERQRLRPEEQWAKQQARHSRQPREVAGTYAGAGQHPQQRPKRYGPDALPEHHAGRWLSVPSYGQDDRMTG